MKLPSITAFLFVVARVSGIKVSPVEKVLQLLGDLQSKIIREGEAEMQAYEDFGDWCKDTSREKLYEIKIGSGKQEDLKAVIEKASSDIDDASVKIEELSKKIASSEKDLESATAIREQENKDFEAANKQLTETVSMLARAQKVLEKEIGKSSFLQAFPGSNLEKVTTTLKQIVEASGIESSDIAELTALLQQNGEAKDKEEDLDTEFGAPDPAVYKSKSGGILDTLADMQEKAETQQAAGQKAEMTAKYNYGMLAMSLKDQIRNYNGDLDDQKKAKAEATEVKSSNEGVLATVEKDLAADTKVLQDTRQECMSRATEFEVESASRAEELKVLAKAKKIIQESMSGSALQTSQNGASFIQLSAHSHLRARTGAAVKVSMHTAMDDVGLHAVEIVRRLAQSVRSPILAQFAQHMSMEFRKRGGADPFVKVKRMIEEMVAKLKKEAQEEAEQKAFCDTEMAETAKSKADKEADIEDLSTKIEKMIAQSAKLREEATTLSREIYEQTKSQEKADKMRAKEKATFEEASAVLQKGLEGVQMALKVLREYYAKGDEEESFAQTAESFEESTQQASSAPKTGAANSIIGLLEVAESDLSKNLEELTAAEDAAQDEYEKVTQDNKVTKAAKQQDVKYNGRESKALAKGSAELTNDRDGMQSELEAVLEYEEKLKPQCITKAPSYEERKKRREQEIEGLKNALSVLEGEAVFLQE